MDIHRPKAAHSIREFLVEIGTIICGILIALSLEQGVEAVHRAHEVGEARRALDAEISHNLLTVHYTIEQAPCVNRRLDELSRWVRSGRNGEQLRLRAHAPGPPGFIFRTSVWRVASVGAVSQMPFEARVGYGQVYDSLEGLEAGVKNANEYWRELFKLSLFAKLDEGQRIQAEFDIGALRAGYAQIAHEDGDFSFTRHAREMGVTKVEQWRDRAEAEQWRAAAADFCKPILATAAN